MERTEKGSEKMKTLKQIFELGDFHNKTSVEDRLNSVKEWLQQKPKPRKVYLEMHRNTMYDRLRAWELWYSKLLEELEQ